MRLKFSLAVLASLLILIFCSPAANGQTEGQSYVIHPDQEVQVASLPLIVADSSSDADLLTASVATAVMNPEICCGRKSALADQVGTVTRFSLEELGAKLRGKHDLDNGESIVIRDEYWPGAGVNAEKIVGTLQAQRPFLMTWNGHLYVLYGAVFDQYVYDDGGIMHVIEKLLLLDPRFDDDRRYVTFNRQTDDWSKVSGLLSLTITK